MDELSLEDVPNSSNSNVYVFPTDDTFNNSTVGIHQFRVDLIGNKNLNKDIIVYLRAYKGTNRVHGIPGQVRIPKGRTYSNTVTVTIPGTY